MIKLPAFSDRQTAWAKGARPILERIAFVLYLAAFVGACGLIGLGLIFALLLEEVRPLCVGLAGGAFARLLHQHGYRSWHFADWEDTFEPSDAHAEFGHDPVQPELLNELEMLLARMEGTASDGEAREIWAVQEARHRARELLEATPELRERYASQLADHPELG